MKILKRVLCVLVCICTCISFCACGKKKTENQTPLDPNANHKNELSLCAVLGEVYKKLDSETKTETDNGYVCFSYESNGNYEFDIYDKYFYESIYMLKVLSESTEIKTNFKLYDDEVLEGAIDGDANKLEMLYIERNKQEYQNNIKIYMNFSNKGANFAENEKPKSFRMFAYEILYNELNKGLNVMCYVERSRISEYSEGKKTNADYFMFEYNNIDPYLTGRGNLQATSFTRTQEIPFENMPENINAGNVSSYDFIRFDCTTNVFNCPNDMTTSNPEVKVSVQEVLKKFNTVEQKVFNVEANKVKVSGLSEKLSKIANANNISDLGI